jgi:hypothetical protein
MLDCNLENAFLHYGPPRPFSLSYLMQVSALGQRGANCYLRIFDNECQLRITTCHSSLLVIFLARAIGVLSSPLSSAPRTFPLWYLPGLESVSKLVEPIGWLT